MKKIIIILLLLWPMVIFSDNQTPERVLVIHSYSESYNWTNRLTQGILDYQPKDADIRIEYMDSKNYYSEEDLQVFHDYMAYKYSHISFDVIITTDNRALQYILEHRDFYGHTPVFFAGVNSMDDFDFSAHEDLYGIIETLSIQDTLEAAKDLKPNLRTIHVVVDSSVTGQSTRNEITKAIDSHYNLVFYDDKTLEEIEFSLRHIDDEEAIVLLAFYIVDPRGFSIDTHIMTERVTQASTVPVFGLYEFSFNFGIVGGKLLSGYEQGKRLVELMDAYYQGSYENRYIETNEVNQNMYDYELLKKFNLQTNEIPKDAIVINKPESFVERYGDILLYVTLIILILIIYIIALRYQVKHQTTKNIIMNQRLSEKEKLASLGEMMNRISHELNTPLGNSIITANYIRKTNNEILEEFNDGKLSKSHLIEKLSGIDYSTNMLEESLEKANELMKAFKVFSDHNDHDNENYFDLVYYLRNLIKTYAPLLHNQGHVIKLKTDDNIVIYGHTKDYYRIFNHLIRNSIDHGFKDLRDKTITIDLSQTNSNLVIKVSDNGIGVSEKVLDNIFKPLYKSESSHHGLGLSQVKEIVTALDGEITCQSNPNKSFTTQIKIPITKKKYEN